MRPLFVNPLSTVRSAPSASSSTPVGVIVVEQTQRRLRRGEARVEVRRTFETQLPGERRQHGEEDPERSRRHLDAPAVSDVPVICANGARMSNVPRDDPEGPDVVDALAVLRNGSGPGIERVTSPSLRSSAPDSMLIRRARPDRESPPVDDPRRVQHVDVGDRRRPFQDQVEAALAPGTSCHPRVRTGCRTAPRACRRLRTARPVGVTSARSARPRWLSRRSTLTAPPSPTRSCGSTRSPTRFRTPPDTSIASGAQPAFTFTETVPSTIASLARSPTRP